MTENRLIPVRRVASGVLAAVVLLLGASTLSAQGTAGKVQGTVLDPTGQPVASAQVFVLGTSFAALTDEEGFYFINNVPAGTYSLRAQFIGYQPAEISDVRILADQTRTVNFRLSGAVALEAITITAAENPIVPRDQVASKAIVTGEDVDQLPVTDALTVVQLQPGVIAGRGGSIRIRGSRANEAVIFVDGTPVRRFDTGATILNLATNTLQEVSVTTGAMDAAFGDAQAGVISMVTRAGGPRFVGTFAYETDEPFGKNTSIGWNRFEGALSGPLFGNLTFSVGGTVNGNRTAVTGKRMTEIPVYTFLGTDTLMTKSEGATDSALVALPHIIQFGGECDASQNLDAAGNAVECQGRRRPYGWSTNVRANAKLQLTYGRGSRISLSGLTDIAQSMSATTMNFENSTGSRTVSNLLVLDWVQQVFRGAESELAFDLNVSYQTDRSLNGAVERQQGLDRRDPFLGIVLSPVDFITDFDRFGPGLASDTAGGGFLITQLKTDDDWDRLIENARYDRGTLRSYLLRDEVNTRSIPRMNAYGVTGGFSNEGVNRGQGFRVERRYVGRANIDWQADRYNRFKFGGEGQIGRIGRWEMSWTRKSFGNGYVGEPYKYGLYAQDRLDLGDVVIEVGIRWDKFNTRTIFPLVPGRIYTNPAFDRTTTVEAMTCPEVEREDCDINQYVWVNSKAHTSLAPRVRVSFPVTDRTGFRLSYAHQTQTPDMFNMYNGTNNDLAATNPNDLFGGDADFGKTILFEFGIRHAFSPDMVLDVAAYNKDKVSDITYRILGFTDTFTGGISNLNVLTNADFGNVRGVDVQLIRRFGNVFSGQVSYTFQNAQSTGSDPTDYLGGLARQSGGVSGDRPEAPQFTLRTRDDRRHNIQGTFALSFPQDFAPGSGIGAVLRGLGVFGTFQFRSGLPYTLLKNNADGQRTTGGFGLGALAAEPLQSSETGWEKLFDLRLTKGFRFGPTDWTVYADIRNILNFTNKPVLFSETGDVVNERYLEEQFLTPQLLRMENDAKASNKWNPLFTKTDDEGTRTLGAIDLRDLENTCPQWKGGGGAVACVMLQRTEQRFGDGDGWYDVEEQTAAVTAWYNLGNGPQTFFGAGRQVRVGLQLTF